MLIRKKFLKNRLKGLMLFSIIIFFLLASSIISVKAQTEARTAFPRKLLVGAKLGYVNSTFKDYNNQFEFAERKSGFTTGIFVNAEITAWVDVAIEASYMQFGANNVQPIALYPRSSSIYNNAPGSIPNVGVPGGIRNIDVRIHSLDIPLLFKLKIPSMNENNFVPSLVVGMTWINHNAADAFITRQTDYTFKSIVMTAADRITSRIVQNEFAPVLGLSGLYKYNDNFRIIADVRWKFGAMNVNNYDFYKGYKSNALTVTVGLAYSINLAKKTEVAKTEEVKKTEVSEADKKEFTSAIKNIHFETAKDVLLPRSTKYLNKIVKIMKANTGIKLQIDGHTDNTGDKNANLTLSQQRADAVKKYLVAQGVEESRLSATGYGDTKPVSDNNTDKGRTENRRVDFVISY